MTSLSTSLTTTHDVQPPVPVDADINDVLGWEGHVNIPSATALTKLLNSWPELRTGLAFSMVFVVGAIAGGVLCALLGCGRQTANE